MVELFPERRRAELFSRALDGHAAPTDARLQELLDTASRLAAVPLVQPRAEFRDSLRARLMEAAAAELPAQAVSATPEPVPAHHGRVADDARAARRRRRLVAIATGLVIIGGGTGVAAASEQALPGDVLYPVKRTVESAEVGLARGGAAEGRALIERAGTRLDEVEALSADLAVDGSRPGGSGLSGVESALDDFATDASTGGSRLLQSYSETGDPADLRALRDFTAESHRVLTGLSGTLPPQAQSSVSSADDTLVALDSMAKRACPDCTAGPPLQGLPAAPALEPDVAGGSTPDVPALTQDRATHQQRTGGDHRANDSPKRQPGAAPAAGGVPPLPDLSLDGTGGQPQQQGTSPDQGGASGGQQDPGLDLGGVLPAPPAPQRTVDAPIPHRLPGNLGHVTDPLTDPLPSLLDGAGNAVGDDNGGNGDGLGGLL